MVVQILVVQLKMEQQLGVMNDQQGPPAPAQSCRQQKILLGGKEARQWVVSSHKELVEPTYQAAQPACLVEM